MRSVAKGFNGWGTRTNGGGGWLARILIVLGITLSQAHSDVVISELMYHPAGTPEDTSLEFIELVNTDPSAAVDLSGWKFTNGVSFEFPAGTSIAAGGYLVIAANPSAGQLGPWEGRLSNSGERVTLTDAQGDTVDTLHYYDEGDWAHKVRNPFNLFNPGWVWETFADGGGSSLELIAATAPNEYGGAWADSTAAGGTPGSVNSVAAASIAPIITEVSHSPAVPRSDEPITVTARVVAAAPGETLTVTANLNTLSGSPSEGAQLDLVTEQSALRATVPDPSTGEDWRQIDFDDSAWRSGVGSVGFDQNPTFLEFIGLDLLDIMSNQNTSAYVRIPFEVADASSIASLALNIRRDDGFIAYINGVEVTGSNRPNTISFLSRARFSLPDENAVRFVTFSASSGIPALVDGTNVLAIHGLNHEIDSSDFLIGPTLVATTSSNPPLSQIEMFDDGQHGDGEAGDGIFGATFPARTFPSINTLRISAESTSGLRDWPGALLDNSAPRSYLEVSDDTDPGQQETYRIIMSEEDYTRHLGLDRTSNALINATFIAGDSVHYLAGVRFRGNSSRRANPPPIRVALAGDDPLDGRTSFNLNSVSGELQVLGMTLFKQSGLPTPSSKAVRVLFNGQNRQTDGQVYADVQPLGDEFLDEHFPAAERGGNMYKKQGGHENNWTYRGEDLVAYQNNGWEKRNNSSAADWQDLFDFHLAVNTDPSDPDNYLAVMEQTGDIDQWLRWYALNNLLNNRETNLSNGADDDYTLYKRPSDGRWIFLPHDLDSILSLGQSGTSQTNETIFQMLTDFGGNQMERVRPLFEHPDVARRYYAQLEDLLQTILSPEHFDRTVDGTIPFVNENERELMKNFMAERRDYVLGLMNSGLAVTTGLAPDQLNGVAPLGTASVLVNGVPAEVDFDGTWAFQYSDGQPQDDYITELDEWQYLDDGSDLGTAWRELDFDDSAWSTGNALLGYGDTGQVTTQINPGGSFGFNRHITHYFRKKFTATQVDDVVTAAITLLRDDGAAVYLNGVEIARDNLPADADAFTLADSEVEGADESNYFSFPFDPALLVEGENVVAVELHLSDPDASPDCRFDLSMTALLDEGSRGLVRLNPGINHLTVTALNSDGEEIQEIQTTVLQDANSFTPLIGTLGEDTVLEAASGPYLIDGTLSVPDGITLTVRPGTSVYFAQDSKLSVSGKLIAAGTPSSRIYFGVRPASLSVPDIHPDLPLTLPKWDGIKLDDSQHEDNIIAYADFEFAQDVTGAIGLTNSVATIIGCQFSETYLRMIYVDHSSVLIEDCTFPDMFEGDQSPAALGLDNTSEHIKGIGGIPTDGHFIIRDCQFGTNRGHNDVIDVDSNLLPEPILQVLDNEFAGAGDELIDLGGDAYIAGNIFRNVAKDADNTDRGYASAISSGDAPSGATIVVTRNIFENVDHAINLKNSDATIFENNTVVGVNPDFTDAGGNEVVASAINLFVDEPGASPAAGGYAANNIFREVPRAFGNVDLPAPDTSSSLSFHHNLIDESIEIPASATNNLTGWPGFTDEGDFSLHSESPARGAGDVGQDLGATAEARIYISGEPSGQTTSRETTLTFGGPGMFAYRYPDQRRPLDPGYRHRRPQRI